jgi:hypothetical protein
MAVKKEKNNERKWIEGAYSHFADVGPEQLNVKRISEITGLPRTNFYYHFPDTDILVTQLLNFHMDVSKEYEKELRQKLKVFIPDLHRILFTFETGIKFHWQLFKHRSDVRFGYIYNSVNSSMPSPIRKRNGKGSRGKPWRTRNPILSDSPKRLKVLPMSWSSCWMMPVIRVRHPTGASCAPPRSTARG